MQRAVTGHDPNGKSVFSEVGEPPRVVEFATGVRLLELWATEATPGLPDQTEDPTPAMESFVPGLAGSRFRIFEIPPDPKREPTIEDLVEFREFARQAALLAPGLGDSLELDNPGMHTTDTVDYIVVISGEADLELDDGAKVRLGPGDCVVQRGTRHAWRNPGDETFVAAAIMIGARRLP